MARQSSVETPDRRILEIATEHVRRYGFRRTTVVGIAEQAGMSHANVYRYFPSKLALVEAVTDHWLKPVEADFRQISDGPDPAYDKLERILGAAQSAYRQKLDTDRQVFALFVEATERDLGIARRHRNRLQAELQRSIEEGISSGVFMHTDHRRALGLIFDALYRFIHPKAIWNDAGVPVARIEARFERVLALVLAGLTRRIRYDE